MAYKEAVYVFGGDNGKSMLNDLLVYDCKGKSWGRVPQGPNPPAPRYHHSAVVSICPPIIKYQLPDGLWFTKPLIYRFMKTLCLYLEATQETSIPILISQIRMICLSTNLAQPSGWSGNLWACMHTLDSKLLSLFYLSSTSNIISPYHSTPVPRSAHGAAVYDGKLYIFAGYDGNARLNDMWSISLKVMPPKFPLELLTCFH